MCPLLRNGGIIVISLVTVALSALNASAFRPPAFCLGRVTATRAKTTIVAYVDNADSKDKRIYELEAENLNLQFKMISDKIDRVDSKIDDVKKDLKTDIDAVKKDLKTDIDAVKKDIDDVKKDLKTDIDDVKKDLKTVSNDLSTVKTGLVAIACICVAPQLPTILAFLK
jgi:prefoldin subunit 5